MERRRRYTQEFKREAWLTPETCDRSLVVAVENCRRLDSGESLLHRVV
jgi:hypothetical protein